MEQLANLEIRLGAQQLVASRGDKSGNALMNAGFARIRTLLKLGNTVERLSILGSYWKLRTWQPKKADSDEEVASALTKMLEAYKAASDLSFQLCGDRDYYPSLNVLDSAIVLAARGNRDAFSELAPMLATWLADAKQNGQRRYAEERDFFHAYAEVEAARVDALWAMLDGRAKERLDIEKVRQRVVRLHCDLAKRMGNPRTQESALRQLHWLMALLPEKGEHKAVRAAVQALLAGIEGAHQ
jgi:hypothetical protein